MTDPNSMARPTGRAGGADAPEPAAQSQPEALIPRAWPIDRYHADLDGSERGAGFIEGYATACEDLLRELTGDGRSGKTYDPMTVDLSSGVMWSYAFDLREGTRKHPLANYRRYDEIASLLLGETIKWIVEEPGLVRAVLAAHASAIEARSGETRMRLDPKDESAVGEAGTPKSRTEDLTNE